MTHGTVAGILIRDLILGRDNKWSKIYDPSRKSLAASSRYAQENLNVAKQFLKHLTPGEVASAGDIPKDCGALVRHGLTKLAVYRDQAGEVHEMSARCPHLGCLVAWNGAERTWDCPCHGSRFDAIGKVISGPANTGLAQVSEHVESSDRRARGD
jgi:Rieske Fe-S protein